MTNRPSPTAVTGLPTTVLFVAPGDNHTCAVLTDGSAMCWGLNANGQLGNASKTNTKTAIPVTGLSSGVAELNAGSYHTCARMTDGTVQCWGSNDVGQLGDGSQTLRAYAGGVTGVAGIVGIASGNSHVLAWGSAGLKVWGRNDYGQLGVGTKVQSLSAVAGPALAGLTSLRAGSETSCALQGTEVKCWGLGANGQLGNLQTSMASLSTQPIVVPGLSPASLLAVGYGHVCSALTSGALWCLGSNGFGESGQAVVPGTVVLQAAAVPAETGVSLVAAGQATTCAVDVTGKLRCFGNGKNGLRGDGSGWKTKPQSVSF